MVTRVISGIVLVLITISTLIFGGWYLFSVCLFISLLGMMEFYKVMKIHKNPLGIIGYLGALAFYASLFFHQENLLMAVLIGTLMLMLAVYVAFFPKYKAEDAMAGFFGLVYVAVMLSYIYQVRVLENGVYIVWLIFICSWGSDTFAYFAGVLFGKHKMTPKLSPKKTIEGLFGGILGASAIGAVYGAIVSGYMTVVAEPVLTFALAGAFGAALSVVGDLAASGIKRDHDVKDYGKIIPGHGGILDRFDSVIFTAPAVFWIVTLFN